MSIFSAPKESAFAAAAFTAAGLDFAAAVAANDTEVIKKALASAKASAPNASADLVAAEATLKAAAKENEELTAKLATETQAKAAAVKAATDAKAEADTAGKLVKAATTFAGVEATTPEDLTKALKAAAGKEGALIVAKAGHPGLEEDVGGKGAATKVKQNDPAATGLTGLAATEAALKARRK